MVVVNSLIAVYIHVGKGLMICFLSFTVIPQRLLPGASVMVAQRPWWSRSCQWRVTPAVGTVTALCVRACVRVRVCVCVCVCVCVWHRERGRVYVSCMCERAVQVIGGGGGGEERGGTTCVSVVCLTCRLALQNKTAELVLKTAQRHVVQTRSRKAAQEHSTQMLPWLRVWINTVLP